MVEHQPSKLDTWVRFPSPAFRMPKNRLTAEMMYFSAVSLFFAKVPGGAGFLGEISNTLSPAAVHAFSKSVLGNVSGVTFRCLLYSGLIENQFQFIDHFFILQTEFDLYTSGSIHIDLTVFKIDRVAHGMAIGGEL